MARFNDTVNLTPAMMRSMANTLRRLAVIYDEMAQKMEDADLVGVHAKSLKTGMDGLANICKFAGYAGTAFCNEVAADAAGEIPGAMFELRKYSGLFEAMKKQPPIPAKRGDANDSGDGSEQG